MGNNYRPKTKEKATSFRFTPTVKNKLIALSEAQGMSMVDVVTNLINQAYIKQKENQT